MDKKHTIEAIDPSSFDTLLTKYPEIVPQKLLGLDEQRYTAIPEAVQTRNLDKHLIKDDLVNLVDWKLSHGKFRPTLKGLVQQNNETAVTGISLEGFSIFDGTGASAKTSLNSLTQLKGVGPATASLLLSVRYPDTAPFFSDELFRWCFYQDGKGKGWDREIKYNLKEYLELFEKVQQLRARFEGDFKRFVSAVEIEKVAYVLGKQSVVSTGSETKHGQKRKMKEESGEASKTTRIDPQEMETASQTSNNANGTEKRKGKAKVAQTEPTRRSQRTAK